MSDTRKTLLALGALSGLVGGTLALSGGNRDTQLLGLVLIIAGIALAAAGFFLGRP